MSKKNKYENNEKNSKKKILKFIKVNNTSDASQNLIDWFDVITDDRWWDFQFLLIIIEKKLDLMHKNWDKSNSADFKLIKKQLKKQKKLLRKIINNTFTKKEEAEHERKWGVLEIKQSDETKYLEFYYPNAKNKKEQLIAKKEWDDIRLKSKKRLKNAERKFFNTFRKQYKGWWD